MKKEINKENFPSNVDQTEEVSCNTMKIAD